MFMGIKLLIDYLWVLKTKLWLRVRDIQKVGAGADPEKAAGAVELQARGAALGDRAQARW